MSNALYSLAKQKILQGDINWLTDNIKSVLVDSDLYTENLLTDEFLSDIPLLARVAISSNFTAKTSALGVADASDISFASVVGAVSEALVVYVDSGDPITSPIVLFVDTATGLPSTPDGNNINIIWDNGVNRIFSL